MIRPIGSRSILLIWLVILPAFAGAAELPKTVYLVPNFHPACCGWLADWSTERNYCANTYLDHLDRVRDDRNYAFALSEVPNLLAILQFEPGRIEELKQRIRENRVELVNAFFLEPTINLSGGEALVKCGVEGLRWQTQVMGMRPRFAWTIDVTGLHEQMAQITSGLGLDGLFYCRHNSTGSTIHWTESPDGTRALSFAPGHYSEWEAVFRSKERLSEQQLQAYLKDLRFRADPEPLSPEQVTKLAAELWAGQPQRTPVGAPVLILGGSGDYSLAPLYRPYPTELIQQFKQIAPQMDLLFSTPGRYVDAVLPGVGSGAIKVPVMRGGTSFSFNAFWIENMRAKSWYRRAEHGLQAAEMLATIASLRTGFEYPVQDLYHAWLMILLNMDRNSLWGSAGGMVFESARSWDVRDRFEAVETISAKTQIAAMQKVLSSGQGVGFFNPLNWQRSDPIEVSLRDGQSLKDGQCQELPGARSVLCSVQLPSVGTVGMDTVAVPAVAPARIPLPKEIETSYYRAVVDVRSGALISLRLKPSGREMLGGPANVIVAEKPKRQPADSGDHIVDRHEREMMATSSQFEAAIAVAKGPLATIVEVRSAFLGGGALRRTIRFYQDYPRIDFETELNDIPDKTVVVAEFPLAETITEVRRGIPFGFSHGAWAKPNPVLHGWTKGIVPAVRWSHYTLGGGGGVALFDGGATGRELTGQTPVIFLLNATDKYNGYPNSWLSGHGKHTLSYALLAHDSPWSEARIPQLAWEFNCPPVVLPDRAVSAATSYVETSPNVIVEAVRREGPEIELRMVEALGAGGTAEVKISLPHQRARLTDLTGAHPKALQAGSPYRFPIRPQQIVTMRFQTARPVDAIKPLLNWEPLVPESKRAALNARINKKGHPPRGDASQ